MTVSKYIDIYIYLYDQSYGFLISLIWQLATKFRNFRPTNGKKESNTNKKKKTILIIGKC